MTTITNLDTVRANSQLFSKMVDLRRAMGILDINGHKITAVSINSGIPIINIIPNPRSVSKLTQKKQQELEIKSAGKVIATVRWQQETNLNQGVIS